MPKKEQTPREKAMEEAKKNDKAVAEKKPLSKADIFKDSIPEAEKEKSGKEPEETK